MTESSKVGGTISREKGKEKGKRGKAKDLRELTWDGHKRNKRKQRHINFLSRKKESTKTRNVYGELYFIEDLRNSVR
jgi:hypothetical protein